MKPILLLLAVSALASGQAPRPTAFDCAVDGVVVNSDTGESIPRVRVIVNGGSATSSATADSSGKWNFSNVACGARSLIVSRFGFLGTASRPLILISGSPAHDVKMELIPQSVVYGRVLDDQGDPLMNAQVRVLASRVVNGQITFQEAQGGNTNDLGDYRIPGLRRGKYIVCAYLAGGLAVAETCYPGPGMQGRVNNNAFDIRAAPGF